MIRPTFETIFMSFAHLLCERSTCRRAQVGCVIASQDFRQAFAIGYNGNVTGGPNDCDRIGQDAVGNCGCIHAEANAVAHCTARRDDKKVVFVTTLPCVMCAKLLINLGGVERVVYQAAYRITDSVRWLSEAGIGIERV